MKKILLLIVAAALLVLYGYGLLLWIRSGNSFEDIGRLIQSDYLLAISMIDLTLFAAACFFWTIRDMKRRSFGTGSITLIIVAMLFTGMITFLLYLAFREYKLESKQPQLHAA